MVSKKIEKARPIRAEIGRQIIDIISSGMYNNPLMVLREYIQNAADSIDSAIAINKDPDEFSIHISLDGKNRQITVFDNGTGISNSEVESRLGSIGNSIKEGTNQRGFRGIGRLGGLGYCDLLRFETRSKKSEQVAVVEWNSTKFNELSESNTKINLSNTIKRIATIRFRDASKDESSHFFKVTLVNIHRFYSDLLMNIKEVKDYLSVVAPIPFNPQKKQFTYASDLESYISQIPNYRTYNLYLNGELIYKPYTDCFEISTNVTDQIKNIQKIEFTDSETGELLGLGWFALTSFRSSLPKRVTFRGIRVKHGNIEVGDERFLEDIFTEKRFAIWHIGEIHLNHNIIPNARRDGFEQNRDYECFLQRAMMIGKGLSSLCRKSSKDRCANVKIEAEISNLEKSTSINTLIDEQHRNQVYEKALEGIATLNKTAIPQNLTEDFSQRLNRLHRKIEKINNIETVYDRIDGRKITHIHQKDLLCEICKRVVEIHQSNMTIEETIEKALYPYFKS